MSFHVSLGFGGFQRLGLCQTSYLVGCKGSLQHSVAKCDHYCEQHLLFQCFCWVHDFTVIMQRTGATSPYLLLHSVHVFITKPDYSTK